MGLPWGSRARESSVGGVRFFRAERTTNELRWRTNTQGPYKQGSLLHELTFFLAIQHSQNLESSVTHLTLYIISGEYTPLTAKFVFQTNKMWT